MTRTRIKLAVLTGVLCMPLLASPQDGEELDIQMRWSKASIMMGEPVWVEVTIRNTATRTLKVARGQYFPDWRQTPLAVRIPEAEPGNARPEPCLLAVSGGSGSLGEVAHILEPGQSVTRRFLLEGPFHFARPGIHRAVVHMNLFSGEAEPRLADRPTPVTRTLELEVKAGSAERLLDIEMGLARQFDAGLNSMPPITAKTDFVARYFLEGELWQIAYGLSMYPAAGMERVYRNWAMNESELVVDSTVVAVASEGIRALKYLNTAEARETLAGIVSSASARQVKQRLAAVQALGEMGDQTYMPLLAKLVKDRDAQVSRAALLAVARLGGDSQVPWLIEMAKTSGRLHDDAIQGLSLTRSPRAVQALIDHFTQQNLGNPGDSNWELFVLTRHRLANGQRKYSLRQDQAEWQQWWDAKKATVALFSDMECP